MSDEKRPGFVANINNVIAVSILMGHSDAAVPSNIGSNIDHLRVVSDIHVYELTCVH